MNLRTVNHLVASVWLIYGLHYSSWFATSIGIVWTAVYVAEVLLAMISFDRRADSLIDSLNRFRKGKYSPYADTTGSDYEPYESRR